MKTIKILGVSVAALGVAASVGGAIALYTKGAQDAGFGIGAGTFVGSTGNVTYKINNATSGSVAPQFLNSSGEVVEGSQGLSEEAVAMRYKFPLSATFDQDLAHQDYVIGKVGVSIENVPAALLGCSQVSVYVEGYGEGTVGKESFKEINYDYQFTAATNEDPAVNSYTGSEVISVASNGGQWLEIYFQITDTSKVNFLAQNEASLPSVSVTWGAKDADYGVAYVVGNGNQWTKDDQYAMAVDITKESWTWVYNNLPGTLVEGKCTHDNGTWSSGDNATLDSSKTYTVTWSGSGEAAATFTEVA